MLAHRYLFQSLHRLSLADCHKSVIPTLRLFRPITMASVSDVNVPAEGVTADGASHPNSKSAGAFVCIDINVINYKSV